MPKKPEQAFEIRASQMDPLTLGYTDTNTSMKTQYSRPDDYKRRVETVWNDYQADPMFKFLLDRMIFFGINGTRWQVKNESEMEFWNEWARQINEQLNAIDILGGLDELQTWIFKSMMLTGMVPMTWEWGTVNVGKKSYKAPVNITVLPSSKVSLKNESGIWGKDVATYEDKGVKFDKNAFILKYFSSPADMSASGVKVSASTANVKPSLYPEPPFFSVHEDIETRLQLREIDRSTVADLLSVLWHISVGDKEHPPIGEKKNAAGEVLTKSTIDSVKESMEGAAAKTAGTRSIYTPYYVDIKKITTDTSVLLNYDKYFAPTLNLLYSFGIFVVMGQDSRLNFTDINTQNFEQIINFARNFHIRRFIENKLCVPIVRANPSLLTEIPSLRYNQLNTQTEAFRTALLELLKTGRMSSRIVNESMGLNNDYVVNDIREEQKKGENGESISDLFNANVPVTFKQQASTDGEPTKTSDTLGTNQGGKPAGKKDADNKGTKEE